jgi:glutathione S-transferase
MSYLKADYEWIELDILQGETRTADFLARNPNGKIPVLELATGQFLFESNAILNYLAEGTPYLPTDVWEKAQVLQWQFFEQYSHEPYIAVNRFIAKYLGMPEVRQAEFEANQAGGQKALAVMEKHLSKHQFFVGNQLTIADISLYAYTHVADEGGFDLSVYPAIRAWLSKIQQHPDYVAMYRTHLGSFS